MALAVTRFMCRCLNFAKNSNGFKLAKRLESSTSKFSDQILLTSCFGYSIFSGNFGRSFWCLASTSARNYESTSSPNTGCLCGGFHSKSDATFSNALTNEISDEKERMVTIPVPSKGWSLKQKGTSCQLTKEFHNECVEVSFNVNDSVSSADHEDSDVSDGIISQPDFIVDMKKPSSNLALSFECFYPKDYERGEHDSIYSIRSVIVYEDRVDERSYVTDTENLDPNLYNHMIKYLEERGINNDFAEELIGIATAVENEEYVNSLEQLQKFVDCS